MILIEDRTHTTYSTDTVEVWTYNMNLKFKIENAHVKMYKDHFEIISHTGEHVATFPGNETAFIMKSPETSVSITQTTNNTVIK